MNLQSKDSTVIFTNHLQGRVELRRRCTSKDLRAININKNMKFDLIYYQITSFLVPDQLSIQFVALYWHDYLIVLSLDHVAVSQHPFPSSFRLVVLEMAFKVSSIRIGPFS